MGNFLRWLNNAFFGAMALSVLYGHIALWPSFMSPQFPLVMSAFLFCTMITSVMIILAERERVRLVKMSLEMLETKGGSK